MEAWIISLNFFYSKWDFSQEKLNREIRSQSLFEKNSKIASHLSSSKKLLDARFSNIYCIAWLFLSKKKAHASPFLSPISFLENLSWASSSLLGRYTRPWAITRHRTQIDMECTLLLIVGLLVLPLQVVCSTLKMCLAAMTELDKMWWSLRWDCLV